MLEYAFQQALPPRLDDRRIANLRTLAEGRVLAQAMRLFLRIDHDPRRQRDKPENQLVEEALMWPALQRLRIDLGTDSRADRRPRGLHQRLLAAAVRRGRPAECHLRHKRLLRLLP